MPSVFLHGHFIVGLFDDGCLGIGDFFTLSNRPALEGQGGGLALEHRARLLADGAHDAHNLSQVLPVPRKACYEVDYTCSRLDICGFGQVIFCCHNFTPYWNKSMCVAIAA